MNNPKGTMRFVGLFHEELVEAAQALHALAEHGDGPKRRELLMSALTACAAALWHAKDMGGDDASFVVVRRPKSRRVRAMMAGRESVKATIEKTEKTR